MRVKIFIDNDTKKLEANINSWLERHPEIYIRFIQQCSDAGTEDLYGDVTITIWYEEANA